MIPIPVQVTPTSVSATALEFTSTATSMLAAGLPLLLLAICVLSLLALIALQPRRGKAPLLGVSGQHSKHGQPRSPADRHRRRIPAAGACVVEDGSRLQA
jgi:hypothetical protein